MDMTRVVYSACVRPWVEPSALQENNNKDKGNTGKEKLWAFCTVDFNTIQSGLSTRIALAWPWANSDIEQAGGCCNLGSSLGFVGYVFHMMPVIYLQKLPTSNGQCNFLMFLINGPLWGYWKLLYNLCSSLCNDVPLPAICSSCCGRVIWGTDLSCEAVFCPSALLGIWSVILKNRRLLGTIDFSLAQVF